MKTIALAVVLTTATLGQAAIQPDGWVPRMVDPADYRQHEIVTAIDVVLSRIDVETDVGYPVQASFDREMPAFSNVYAFLPEGYDVSVHRHWRWRLRIDFDWPTDYVHIPFLTDPLFTPRQVKLKLYGEDGELFHEELKVDWAAEDALGFIEYQSDRRNISAVEFGGYNGQLAYALKLHFNGPNLPGTLLGDMDVSRVVDAFDVDDFELALSNPNEYAVIHPGFDPVRLGDINRDESLDAFDISAFEILLTTGSPPSSGRKGGGRAFTPLPEPATIFVLALAGIVFRLRRPYG